MIKSLMEKAILPSDTPLDFGPIVFQAHLNSQTQLTHLLNAKQITNTHSTHYVHTEQPQLIIEAIKEVVEKARASLHTNK